MVTRPASATGTAPSPHTAQPATKPGVQSRTEQRSVVHAQVLKAPARKSSLAPRSSPARKGKRVRDDRALLAEMIEHYASEPRSNAAERTKGDSGKASGDKAALDASARTARLVPPAGSTAALAAK